jgi:hypothetical protein
MKPFETQKAFSDQFNTLEELSLCIEKIRLVSNQEPFMIHCEGELELERECLSDGSIAYNVHLHGDIGDEEHDSKIAAG